MQSVQKTLLRLFSSSLPIFPVYFQIVMPRHVLSACYARYVHTKGVFNLLLGMLCEFTSAKHTVLYEVTNTKHACLSLENIWMENGQTGGKNSRRTFVLTAFISFGLTNVLRLPVEPGWHLPPQTVPLAEKRFLRAGKVAESRKEKSKQCFTHDEVSFTTQSQGLKQSWRQKWKESEKIYWMKLHHIQSKLKSSSCQVLLCGCFCSRFCVIARVSERALCDGSCIRWRRQVEQQTLEVVVEEKRR